jgi:hypothetical protein
LLLLDVLSGSADDFSTEEDVFEAVGAILQEVDESKSEEDIR